jgi:hypothetical protein
MVVRDSDDSADGSSGTREVPLREEVLLGGVEDVSSLTRDRDSKTTIVDVKFGAVGPGSNCMILQAQRNACGQPGFSGQIVPSSKSRFSDEPGTGRGRAKYVVRTYSLDDGVVCCAKAVPRFLGMILQEAIPHVYNALAGASEDGELGRVIASGGNS